MWINNYIEDYFSPDTRDKALRIVPRVSFMLRWVTIAPRCGTSSVSFTLFDLVNVGIYDIMPRTKRTPDKPVNSGLPQKPAKQEGTMRWINVPLGEDDIDYLANQSASNEVLGGLLLGVALQGYGFSVKRMPDEVTYMCAIMGQNGAVGGGSCGVSAFSDNPRDATLACLYKFTQRLGGTFDGHADDSAPIRPRFR